MKFKIISDSSCDLNPNYLDGTGIDFGIAPLTIHVGGKTFVDDANINIEDMLSSLNSFQGKATTSCPAPGDYYQEMEGADYYFIVTISGKLSGSYNAALVAKDLYDKPENVFVVDSKTTSGSMILIIDKLVELINKNETYENICAGIKDYVDNHLGLYFVLEKFDNLVKNGRVSAIKARIASAISIKPICEAEDGEIKFSKNAFGFTRAIKTLAEEIEKKAPLMEGKQCVISHCFNPEVANRLHDLVSKKFKELKIRVISMRGLCSFYALEKGIIVGYEI